MADAPPRNGEFQNGKLWFERKGLMVTVGITSSAVDSVGTIEGIELPDAGEDFVKGEAVGSVDGTHGSIELIAPAAGVVSEINEAAQSEPDMVTEDPLEEGWLIKLEIEDGTDLQDLPGTED